MKTQRFAFCFTQWERALRGAWADRDTNDNFIIIIIIIFIIIIIILFSHQ